MTLGLTSSNIFEWPQGKNWDGFNNRNVNNSYYFGCLLI